MQLESICIAAVLLVAACAPESPPRAASAASASASSARVEKGLHIKIRKHHVLSKKISLQEPLTLTSQDDALVLTFAQRGREGVTMAIDARSFEIRASTPLVYAEHARPNPPPHLSREPVRLRLEEGWSLWCWTDVETKHVMARAIDPNGAEAGVPIVVSRASMDVMGPPRGVTLDERDVVIAFFETTDDGYELVAASIRATVL